jgi:aspartate racemase
MLLSAGVFAPVPGVTALNRDLLNKRILDRRLSGTGKVYTAHPFIDDFRQELPIPLVHIVEATLAEAKRRISSGGWLVATSGTVASGIYQNEAQKWGYPLHVPADDVQPAIQETTALVKANRTEEAAKQLRGALQRLWDEKNLPIVAACTEVPLAHAAADLPPEGMVSSLEALASGCLRELYR